MKYQDTKNNKYKYDLRPVNLPGSKGNSRRKEPKDNNNRLSNYASDNTITDEQHDKLMLLKNMQDSFNKSKTINAEGKSNWERIFKKIPMTDELLKFSDDKRKSDIYNDLLRYFYEHYESFDTYERKEFFRVFPEMMDHLKSKVKDNIKANKKFAKFSLRGVKSREDMEYLYKVGHLNSDEINSDYFSESIPQLSKNIVSSFLSLPKYKDDNDNFSTGRATTSKYNDYTSGLIKRTWRNYQRGKFNEEDREGLNERPILGPEPQQHFLFEKPPGGKMSIENDKDGKAISKKIESLTKDISNPKSKENENIEKKETKLNKETIASNLLYYADKLNEFRNKQQSLAIDDDDYKRYYNIHGKLIVNKYVNDKTSEHIKNGLNDKGDIDKIFEELETNMETDFKKYINYESYVLI